MLVVVVWTVLGQLEMAQAPEMVGPAADVIRPGERPVQARALKLPASVNRKWLQDMVVGRRWRSMWLAPADVKR